MRRNHPVPPDNQPPKKPEVKDNNDFNDYDFNDYNDDDFDPRSLNFDNFQEEDEKNPKKSEVDSNFRFANTYKEPEAFIKSPLPPPTTLPFPTTTPDNEDDEFMRDYIANLSRGDNLSIESITNQEPSKFEKHRKNMAARDDSDEESREASLLALSQLKELLSKQNENAQNTQDDDDKKNDNALGNEDDDLELAIKLSLESQNQKENDNALGNEDDDLELAIKLSKELTQNANDDNEKDDMEIDIEIKNDVGNNEKTKAPVVTNINTSTSPRKSNARFFAEQEEKSKNKHKRPAEERDSKEYSPKRLNKD